MPHPNRPRPSQLHHHQTHGAEPDAQSARQGLHTPQAKGRRMGRRLPRQPHRSIICSPDSPVTGATISWLCKRSARLVLIGMGRPLCTARGSGMVQHQGRGRNPDRRSGGSHLGHGRTCWLGSGLRWGNRWPSSLNPLCSCTPFHFGVVLRLQHLATRLCLGKLPPGFAELAKSTDPQDERHKKCATDQGRDGAKPLNWKGVHTLDKDVEILNDNGPELCKLLRCVLDSLADVLRERSPELCEFVHSLRPVAALAASVPAQAFEPLPELQR